MKQQITTPMILGAISIVALLRWEAIGGVVLLWVAYGVYKLSTD